MSNARFLLIIICTCFYVITVPNNLTGTLPPEFGHLVDVTTLLFENQKDLYGSLPLTMSNMRHLQSISILFFGHHFGGVIPPSIFDTPAMKYITIMLNDGVWKFPSSIEPGLKNNLLQMSIKSSGLSGTLPSFLSQFTNIQTLELADNDLDGTIPDYFGSLSSLQYLNLHGNNLNGTLPQSLSQLVNLTAMAFGKNNLQGSLPSSLGKLSKLKLLDLSANQLEGPIPAEFSMMSSLERLSLQSNANLNGSIVALEPLGRLSSLSLYSNRFSSTIPNGMFSNFTRQLFVDIGHNTFTGTLPEAFSRYAKNTSKIPQTSVELFLMMTSLKSFFDSIIAILSCRLSCNHGEQFRF